MGNNLNDIAMVFLASLEYKIKYKYPKKLPDNILKELKYFTKMVSKVDMKMYKLGEKLIDDFEKK